MPYTEQPWDVFTADCPSRQALALVADKWTTLVLHALGAHGVQRRADLRRRVGGVSEKMLTRTLRDLERNGLVSRTDHGTVPPRVDYALTPLGDTLHGTVAALCEWVMTNMAEVRAAQAAFDAHPRIAAPWQQVAVAGAG